MVSMKESECANQRVEQYLASLEAELRGLPATERREIVLETRSHIVERSSSMITGDVLAELGPAHEYARQFFSQANEPVPYRLLPLLGRLPENRWIVAPVTAAIVMLYALAAVTAAIATAKLLSPSGTGLWIEHLGSARRFAFHVSPTETGPPGEVLGWWLVVLGYGVAVLIHFGVVSALRRLVLRQQRHRLD